jgi:hypothetical protein
MKLNYTDAQLETLAASGLTVQSHESFWQIMPELTFEQSVDWCKKGEDLTHKITRAYIGGDEAGVDAVVYASLDFKVVAGLPRTDKSPVQQPEWKNRVALTLIPTEKSGEDNS